MTGGDLLQRALEPGVGLDVVHLAGLDERADTAPGARALVVAREQRILRGEFHRPFILPMSGRIASSIILGMPISAAVSALSASSTV